MESKLLDTKYAIDSGADEIDIVINRKAFLEGAAEYMSQW